MIKHVDEKLPKWAKALIADYEEPAGVWGPFSPGDAPPPLASRESIEAFVPNAIIEGRREGYPECCIRHFVETVVKLFRDGERPENRIHPVDNRVMCARCAAALESDD